MSTAHPRNGQGRGNGDQARQAGQRKRHATTGTRQPGAVRRRRGVSGERSQSKPAWPCGCHGGLRRSGSAEFQSVPTGARTMHALDIALMCPRHSVGEALLCGLREIDETAYNMGDVRLDGRSPPFMWTARLPDRTPPSRSTAARRRKRRWRRPDPSPRGAATVNHPPGTAPVQQNHHATGSTWSHGNRTIHRRPSPWRMPTQPNDTTTLSVPIVDGQSGVQLQLAQADTAVALVAAAGGAKRDGFHFSCK